MYSGWNPKQVQDYNDEIGLPHVLKFDFLPAVQKDNIAILLKFLRLLIVIFGTLSFELALDDLAMKK